MDYPGSHGMLYVTVHREGPIMELEMTAADGQLSVMVAEMSPAFPDGNFARRLDRSSAATCFQENGYR